MKKARILLFLASVAAGALITGAAFRHASGLIARLRPVRVAVDNRESNQSVILCEVFAQVVNPEGGIAGLDLQEQLCCSQLVVEVKGC